MNIYSDIRFSLGRWRKIHRYQRIYEKFCDFTMIPAEVYNANLAIAESIFNLPGCIVECGVWRGGMIAGIATVIGRDRQYYLFDSFEGLPPAQAIDGEGAINWQKDVESPTYYDNCSAPIEFAEQAMHLAEVNSFQLNKGWFKDTLPGFIAPQPIALLRLDADWYDSTIVCLENLFHQVVTNGLIILDDYYTWDGCSRALHDFLSKHSASERIHTSGAVCYLRKL